jgi:hypothetical protein
VVPGATPHWRRPAHVRSERKGGDRKDLTWSFSLFQFRKSCQFSRRFPRDASLSCGKFKSLISVSLRLLSSMCPSQLSSISQSASVQVDLWKIVDPDDGVFHSWSRPFFLFRLQGFPRCPAAKLSLPPPSHLSSLVRPATWVRARCADCRVS